MENNFRKTKARMKIKTFIVLVILLCFLNVSFCLNLNSCQDINTPDRYNISTNIYAVQNCFNILSDDVMVDCLGHTINGQFNLGNGFHISGYDNITIKNCNIQNFDGSGIYFESVTNSHVFNTYLDNNDISGFEVGGIYILSSSYNVFENVSSNNNGNDGFYLESSNNNEFKNVVSEYNFNEGFESYLASYNTFDNISSVKNDFDGIFLDESNYNIIKNSYVVNNDAADIGGVGLIMRSSQNNFVYNNYFNNTVNIDVNDCGYNSNKFNATKTPSTNIVSKPYLGGNFWAQPNGLGFSQVCSANEYGFCQSSYDFTQNGYVGIDSLPLSNNILIVDSQAPHITLIAPSTNEVYNLSKSVEFIYNVTDDKQSSIVCNLSINGTVVNSSIVTNNSQNIFTKILSDESLYYYTISCDDGYNINTTSQIFFSINLSKPNFVFNYLNWDNTTTNFSAYTKQQLKNLNNVTFSNTNGKIEFLTPLTIERSLVLDDNIEISSNFIFINFSLNEFNKNANLTLYNITFTTPQILRNGAVCSVTVCNFLSYINNTLKFNVTGFSSYTIRETPTCSDGVQNQGETGVDCGGPCSACQSSSSSSSSSSSGSSGGGSSRKTTKSTNNNIISSSYQEDKEVLSHRVLQPKNEIVNEYAIMINGDSDLSKNYTKENKVIFKDKKSKKKVLEFDYDFSENELDLGSMAIEASKNSSEENYVIIKNLTLPEGKTKTIYLSNVHNYSAVCIKDSQINSVKEISSNCTSKDEYLIRCDGTKNGDYECKIVDGFYVISGLKHSGVLEVNSTSELLLGNGEENSYTDNITNKSSDTLSNNGSAVAGGIGNNSGDKWEIVIGFGVVIFVLIIVVFFAYKSKK